MPGALLFTPFAASACVAAPAGCIVGNALLAGGAALWQGWNKDGGRTLFSWRNKFRDLQEKDTREPTFQVPWQRQELCPVRDGVLLPLGSGASSVAPGQDVSDPTDDDVHPDEAMQRSKEHYDTARYDDDEVPREAANRVHDGVQGTSADWGSKKDPPTVPGAVGQEDPGVDHETQGSSTYAGSKKDPPTVPGAVGQEDPGADQESELPMQTLLAIFVAATVGKGMLACFMRASVETNAFEEDVEEALRELEQDTEGDLVHDDDEDDNDDEEDGPTPPSDSPARDKFSIFDDSAPTPSSGTRRSRPPYRPQRPRRPAAFSASPELRRNIRLDKTETERTLTSKTTANKREMTKIMKNVMVTINEEEDEEDEEDEERNVTMTSRNPVEAADDTAPRAARGGSHTMGDGDMETASNCLPVRVIGQAASCTSLRKADSEARTVLASYRSPRSPGQDGS